MPTKKQTKTVKKSVTDTTVSKGTKAISEKPKGFTLAHFNFKGEKERLVSLPGDLFGEKADPKLLAQAVRVYQANLRQGTQSTKTRGEVTGSTRKIYRQKGTGRARHGAITAPIFVGGGIAFGPKPRDFSLKFPKKMRRKALVGLLRQKAEDGNLTVISGLNNASGKTKEMAELFGKMAISGKRLLLVLTPEQGKALKGARNIERVNIRPATQLSPLDVVTSDKIVLAQEALPKFKSIMGSDSKTKL